MELAGGEPSSEQVISLSEIPDYVRCEVDLRVRLSADGEHHRLVQVVSICQLVEMICQDGIWWHRARLSDGDRAFKAVLPNYIARCLKEGSIVQLDKLVVRSDFFNGGKSVSSIKNLEVVVDQSPTMAELQRFGNDFTAWFREKKEKIAEIETKMRVVRGDKNKLELDKKSNSVACVVCRERATSDAEAEAHKLDEQWVLAHAAVVEAVWFSVDKEQQWVQEEHEQLNLDASIQRMLDHYRDVDNVVCKEEEDAISEAEAAKVHKLDEQWALENVEDKEPKGAEQKQCTPAMGQCYLQRADAEKRVAMEVE